MTADAHDPRISQILQLVSQLTNHPGIMNRETHDGDGDDIDCIVEMLTALIEEQEVSKVSRNFLLNITDSMLDSMIITDLDGRITMVNRAACQLLGFQESELIAQPINHLFVQLFKIDDPAGRDLEERTVVAKDGRHIPVSCSRSQLRNHQGQPEGFICVAQDITERKQTEESLVQNQVVLQATLESMQDGLLVVTEDGKVSHHNSSFCQMWTIPENLMAIGNDQDLIDHVLPQLADPEQFTARINAVYQTSAVSEDILHLRDGRLFERVSYPLIQDGQEKGRVWVFRDVTERKRAEEALRLTSFAVESMSDAVHWIAPDHRIVDVNEAACHMLGYTREELIGMSVSALDPMFSIDELTGFWNRVKGEGALNFETVHKTKDGRILPVEIMANYIAFEGKELNCCFVRDISQRKQAEEALLQSEERLRQAVRAGSIGIFDHDHVNDTIYWSPEHRRIYGLDLEERVTLPKYLEQIYPDDRERIKAAVQRAHDPAGDGNFDVEHRNIDRSGVIHWLSVRSHTFFDGEGSARRPVRTIGAVVDITERKRIENELRQSEARYRAVIESQVDLISRYRPDTILTFVNDAYCRFYGKTREELIGHSFLMMIAPEFRELVKKETEEIAKNAIPVSGEYLNFGADGKACWIQWVIQAIVDENGQVVELQGVGRDVTRLKQTETALRESEYFLQKSQTVGRIGSYYFDVRTGQWISSPMLDKIFGIDDRFVKDTEGWIALVHPEEKEEMLRYLHQHVLTEHNRFDKEYRIKRFDNHQGLWVHGIGELEFDESGTAIKMIGTVQDITERKQMEEALRDSENRLSVIFNQSADLQALSSVEPDGTFRLVTINNRYLEAVQRNFGVSEQDIIGKPLIDVLRDVFGSDEAVCRDVLDNYKRVVSSGQVFRYEETLDAPLGTFYAEAVLVPIFESSKTCRYILYSARDISERKQAEEEIRQLNEELEQRVIERTQELEEANEEIRHFAYIVSHDLRAPLVNLKGFAAELRSGLKMVEEGLTEVLPLVASPQRDRMMYALQEDIPESLRFIESSVSNMDTFTKAILKLSRLGRLHLELVEVDVRSLVEKTLETLSYQINQRGIRVTIGDLPVITADFVSMEQIFGNILTNAVMYLDPNRPGEIDISAERAAGDIIFCIRDNGRGIAPEDMDKVFAPFRRAGKQDVAGEGMGLAYVQTLVRRHGGRIWCDSQAGVGTTFTFTIPRNLTNDTAGW